MEKGSNQPPISGTKKAAHKYDLFVMAERKGFEPLWLAPNGFQDRLVMTASIPLRSDCNILYFNTRGMRCQANFFLPLNLCGVPAKRLTFARLSIKIKARDPKFFSEQRGIHHGTY